ncbi:MAG: hypothetical protein DRI61_09435, partial [Chloroflexi bacterium]
FKEFNTYNMHVGGDFEEVGIDGEIKSGKLTESSYSNQVKTYGESITLDRRKIVNDDVNAFSQLPTSLGYKGKNKLTKEAMTLLLANTGSFFSAGNGNYNSGGGSTLSIDSLNEAKKDMRQMKTEVTSGDPTGFTPAYLLVPPALESTALQLMKSERVVTGEDATRGDININRGLAEVVVEPWLSTVFGLTGSSDTGWYLLADKVIGSVVSIAYLRGQKSPVLKQVELVGSTLGKSWICYFDFGVAQFIKQAGVFSAGA